MWKRNLVLALVLATLVSSVVFVVTKTTKTHEPALPEKPTDTETTPSPAPFSQKTIIGTSTEGRPIEAATYGTGTTTLLFVGGMHGGYEWNSTLLAYTFMDYLEAHHEFVPDTVTIAVIPDINPDGTFAVVHKEGRFALSDIPKDEGPLGNGRFNAHNVDLNRNFDCRWQPESTWRSQKVSAGTSAFSELESAALRDYVAKIAPKAVTFWHSQANAVYASECGHGVLPQTTAIMRAYAGASGYKPVATFDAYPVTGDAEGWLASIGIPAITVELSSHNSIEWDKNLRGVKALVQLFAQNTPS